MPARNMLAQLLALYTNPESHNSQRHRQTDGWQDDANSRSNWRGHWKCWTWKWRTWNWPTDLQGMKLQDMKLMDQCAGHENDGLKMQDMKLQDVKMQEW